MSIHGLINTGLTLIRGITSGRKCDGCLVATVDGFGLQPSRNLSVGKISWKPVNWPINRQFAGSWAGNRDFIDFYRQDVGVPYETIQNGNRMRITFRRNFFRNFKAIFHDSKIKYSLVKAPKKKKKKRKYNGRLVTEVENF